MTDAKRTVAEATDGTCFFVEFDEDTSTVRFTTEQGAPAATYAYATFAEITAALALDVGRDVILDDETVAALQQFGDLDAFGLNHR